MARLTHIKSGAVVEVADEKVARMGSEWEPVKAKAPAKKAAVKRSEK
jgi:hypothetical protein